MYLPLRKRNFVNTLGDLKGFTLFEGFDVVYSIELLFHTIELKHFNFYSLQLNLPYINVNIVEVKLNEFVLIVLINMIYHIFVVFLKEKNLKGFGLLTPHNSDFINSL